MKNALTFLLLLLTCTYGQAQKAKWVVAANGPGNFTTVQAALNAIPFNNKKQIIIFIKSGFYKEKLVLDSSKNMVTLIGENKFTTILSYDDHTGKISPKGDTISTRTSASFVVKANECRLENLTIENTAGPTAGQAVGLEIQGDKAIISNCRIIGDQDILYVSKIGTRQYFSGCYIEGTTDFIFGPSSAWFQNCHIHSKKNSHITAASTPQQQAYGFVFNDCILTGDSALQNVSLGRPWRPYASVLYMHCYIGSHIKPEGWSNWNSTDNYKFARFAEYKNYGAGSAANTRVTWSKQLTDAQAALLNMKAIFAGWNPLE